MRELVIVLAGSGWVAGLVAVAWHGLGMGR